MQLIDNWKQALSMTSVQAGGAIAALGVADYFGLADAVMAQLHGVMSPLAYSIMGVVVMVARVVLQKKLSK
jgi:hypothetical protein